MGRGRKGDIFHFKEGFTAASYKQNSKRKSKKRTRNHTRRQSLKSTKKEESSNIFRLGRTKGRMCRGRDRVHFRTYARCKDYKVTMP